MQAIGREGGSEDWRKQKRQRRSSVRHMLTVPSRVDTAAIVKLHASDGSSSSSSSPDNSFRKDGRKISVGDCALFKPPQDSPPFIGIIRSLFASQENKLQLGVNWLYRPAEVKLSKGGPLEAAPNELFYSFHTDKIPAASVLHPCKVAFLPRGVDLPSGICSFVCRRVYDTTNKRLWWLTDQDYINERQEEVDQLLYKTRIEMHASVQTGGRSPKRMNLSTSSQLKGGSDSVQNSASSFGSQGKGKKRDREDLGSEPVKRECLTREDDNESGQCKPETSLKSEIAKFTDKGGLIDSEGVAKLIHLMLPERKDKKVDLVGRSMLAGVIASTEKLDCLSWFVQLRGLPILDEWLQEAHKGKIRDGDKAVDDFLLVLLRALDKLPVDLQALQMCNIGKSVNHLRSHKNMEIQRKARTIVDTWKKRVEAEMNINDGKFGSNQTASWHTRQRLSEVPHGHGASRNPSGSSEVPAKCSMTQNPSSKTLSVKPVQSESATKSASVSPGSIKSSSTPASAILKDCQLRSATVGGTSDPAVATRGDKSSSSSPSHNSQSCSSDIAKAGVITTKEDARSSPGASVSVNKASGSSSRHRKSVNGFQGSASPGVQRESGSSRSSSVYRPSGSDKLSQSGLTIEKAVDVLAAEGSGHKLIVKIPNRGRSPARSTRGGFFDESSITNSGASSPVPSEKHDQNDHSLKEKLDGHKENLSSDMNAETWQGNDYKDVRAGSDEGRGSPTAAPNEDQRSGDDGRKLVDVSKSVSSSENQHKSNKMNDSSLTSINVFIESCVKYCEASMPMQVGDDVGMNLLASVAAGEISKSDLTSPSNSPQRNTPAVEHSSVASDSGGKSSANDLANDCMRLSDCMDNDHEKLAGKSGCTGAATELQQSAEPCIEGSGKSTATVAGDSISTSYSSTVEKTSDSEGVGQIKEKMESSGVNAENGSDTKPDGVDYLSTEEKKENSVTAINVEMGDSEGMTNQLLGTENKKNLNEGSNSAPHVEQKPPAMISHSQFAKGTAKEVLLLSGSGKVMVADANVEIKTERADKMEVSAHSCEAERQNSEQGTNGLIKAENCTCAVGAGAVMTDQDVGCVAGNLENTEIHDKKSSEQASNKVPQPFVVQEMGHCVRLKGSKLSGMDEDDAKECASSTAEATSRPASGSDDDAKAVFDLNEGLNADDGKHLEQNNMTPSSSKAPVPLISPLPLPVSTLLVGFPASITVAAAAKGPFVPPEDLLRNKGELGWKGSAATSAFRPAEPRKVSDVSTGSSTSGKSNRPPLDIDLNVADDRILEDTALQVSQQETSSSFEVKSRDDGTSLRGSAGLDLDLNQVMESADGGNYSGSSGRRPDVPLLPVKSSTVVLPNGKGTACRNFDLNDGPAADEATAEPLAFSQQTRSSMPLQPSVSALRMNTVDMGNLSSWFSSGNTYSAVKVSSVLPDRGEQPFPIVAAGGPQRMLAHPTGSGTSFNADIYRGHVLQSSPAMPFASTPFQYPVFPFGSGYPLPSATFSGSSATYVDSSSGARICFPAGPSQLLGPPAAVSSPFPRPYVGLSDGSSSTGAENSRKWGRQGLDLNSGPGGQDVEGRDETGPPLGPRQLSVASSQAPLEDQVSVYQVPGASLKRKEPEGGWDGYKKFSWQ